MTQHKTNNQLLRIGRSKGVKECTCLFSLIQMVSQRAAVSLIKTSVKPLK